MLGGFCHEEGDLALARAPSRICRIEVNELDESQKDDGAVDLR